MGLLLDALELLPPGTVAARALHLTGIGPGLAPLAPRIDALRRRGICIQTGFLPPADYHGLLARADLGLGLHRSSSGLDLAMKVVDIVAEGVPVAALDYGPALREQVREGVNGLIFRDAAQLAQRLAGFARDPSGLDALRQAQLSWGGKAPWIDGWRAVMPRLLRRAPPSP